MVPWVHPSSHSKRHRDRFNRFCRAVEYGRLNRIRQVAPMCTPCNTCFLGPTRVHNRNGISVGSAVFDSSRQSVVGHARACPFPLNYALACMGRSGPPSNTRFLWPTQVQISNGISIGSAVFAQLIAERPCTLQWRVFGPHTKSICWSLSLCNIWL